MKLTHAFTLLAFHLLVGESSARVMAPVASDLGGDVPALLVFPQPTLKGVNPKKPKAKDKAAMLKQANKLCDGAYKILGKPANCQAYKVLTTSEIQGIIDNPQFPHDILCDILYYEDDRDYGKDPLPPSCACTLACPKSSIFNNEVTGAYVKDMKEPIAWTPLNMNAISRDGSVNFPPSSSLWYYNAFMLLPWVEAAKGKGGSPKLDMGKYPLSSHA